nr:EAL domain-containing protein [Kineococcus xinjiangensis]
MVALAHALDLKVVAEGVETERQRLQARDLGCDLLQGFGLAPPLSAVEVGTLVGSHA